MSAFGELQKRLAAPPQSLRSLLLEVPQALDELVTRCTEPDAAKRYQTTTELVAAIERLDDNGKRRPNMRVVRLPYAIAADVVLLVLSGCIWWATRPPITHEGAADSYREYLKFRGNCKEDPYLPDIRTRVNG